MRKLAGKDADSQLVLELWNTALPFYIQGILTLCCDEQTGKCKPDTERTNPTYRPFPSLTIWDVAMTSTRPAPPDTTALVGIGTKERYEYHLLRQDRGLNPASSPRRAYPQDGPGPPPVYHDRPGHLSATITKKLHDTAGTIPAMAHRHVL